MTLFDWFDSGRKKQLALGSNERGSYARQGVDRRVYRWDCSSIDHRHRRRSERVRRR